MKLNKTIYKAIITTDANNKWIIIDGDEILFEHDILDGCYLEDSITIEDMPKEKGIYTCEIHVSSCVSYSLEDSDMDLWLENIQLIFNLKN